MKIIKSSYVAPIAFVALIAFNSCGGNSDNVTNITENKVDAEKKDADSAGQTKVYSLPAPMQIASAIKKTNPKFIDGITSPIRTDFTSDFNKIINLGIYAVDLGYSNVYEQNQSSLNYFTAAAKIADELRILGAFDPGYVKRYRDNSNNKDSVMLFTLRSFNNIHEYLINNNRTDDAYVLLTGSFIEGAYLSSKIQNQNKDKALVQVIGQQKLFLESILELLAVYKDKKEINDLITELTELNQIYAGITITYSTTTDINTKKIEPLAISEEGLKQIGDKLTAIRNSLVISKK